MRDVYRDAFKKFLAEGMTHLEALEQFDREKMNDALRESLEIDGHNLFTAKDRYLRNDWSSGNELLDLLSVANREESNKRDLETQAIPLWLAGWTSESDGKRQEEVMSWYWRAPSKRLGKPGRKYLSTSQAFNAMVKSQTR